MSIQRLFSFASMIAMLAAHCGAQSAGIEVKAQPFVADFYCVTSSIPKPGILLLGGSEGGRPKRTPA